MAGAPQEPPSADALLRRVAKTLPFCIYVRDVGQGLTTWLNVERPADPGGPLPARTPPWVDAAGARPHLHPDDADNLEEWGRRLRQLPDGQWLETEYRVRTDQGGHRWLLSRDTVLARAPDGQPTRILGTVIDVTERRAMLERTQQGQRMEALGRLAGGIAHDFNNLMAAILGNAEIGLRECGRGLSAEPQLLEIHSAASRGADLSGQLLTFARRQQQRPRPVHLHELLQENLGLLRRLVGDAIALEIQADPAAGAVLADPTQLVQVLMNLLVNARDAMPDGGRVTVRTARAEQSPEGQRPGAGNGPRPQGPWVRLSVEDRGVGMSPEVQAQAFEPFFSTKPEGKGTGLGLATVYGIVRQSGGLVRLHSEIDRGTRVDVYLPLYRDADAAQSSA